MAGGRRLGSRLDFLIPGRSRVRVPPLVTQHPGDSALTVRGVVPSRVRRITRTAPRLPARRLVPVDRNSSTRFVSEHREHRRDSRSIRVNPCALGVSGRITLLPSGSGERSSEQAGSYANLLTKKEVCKWFMRPSSRRCRGSARQRPPSARTWSTSVRSSSMVALGRVRGCRSSYQLVMRSPLEDRWPSRRRTRFGLRWLRR